nr:Chain F, Histone H3 peptide [Homo sapiens]
ARTKQTARKSY